MFQFFGTAKTFYAFAFQLFSSPSCLMLVVVTMAVIIMTLPRMSPAKYYRTILLSSVHDPKPHDGAQALSGDSMPSLGSVNGDAFVCSAMSMASSSHLSLSPTLAFASPEKMG